MARLQENGVDHSVGFRAGAESALTQAAAPAPPGAGPLCRATQGAVAPPRTLLPAPPGSVVQETPKSQGQAHSPVLSTGYLL